MLSAVIALAVFGTLALGWMNARAAAEVAAHYGRRACEESQVQWLDHTVMLERISLRRAPDGWIRLLRRYRFDFSTNGVDRHRGQLELLGNDLQWLNIPPPPSRALPVVEASGWQVHLPLTPPATPNSDTQTNTPPPANPPAPNPPSQTP